MVISPTKTDDDDDLTGWNGVGVIGALMEEDVFSRSTTTTEGGGSLMLTMDDDGCGTAERSASLCDSHGMLRQLGGGRSITSSSSRRTGRSQRSVRTARSGRRSPGGALPSSGSLLSAPGDATVSTFATANQGSAAAWGDDDNSSCGAEEFHSVCSRERHSLNPGGLLLAALDIPGVADDEVAAAGRPERFEPIYCSQGNEKDKNDRHCREDDIGDDALSVVSDAVSSLTSATTLFGRADHGRDPAVVVGELWRIQGLLRAAMKEKHGGGGGDHRDGVGGGDVTMEELRRNGFRRRQRHAGRDAGERWG